MRVDFDHGSPEGRAARTTALSLLAAPEPRVRAEILTGLVNTRSSVELVIIIESLALISRTLAV